LGSWAIRLAISSSLFASKSSRGIAESSRSRSPNPSAQAPEAVGGHHHHHQMMMMMITIINTIIVVVVVIMIMT
jgi:hypothetical protein